ncbi:MAG: hypothetical protein AAF675_15475, partial [Pseudomonadota bacterium]
AARLTAHYGDMAGPLRREAAALMEIAPEGALIPLPQGGFEVAPAWKTHARLIASAFDAYLGHRIERHSAAL